MGCKLGMMQWQCWVVLTLLVVGVVKCTSQINLSYASASDCSSAIESMSYGSNCTYQTPVCNGNTVEFENIGSCEISSFGSLLQMSIVNLRSVTMKLASQEECDTSSSTINSSNCVLHTSSCSSGGYQVTEYNNYGCTVQILSVEGILSLYA